MADVILVERDNDIATVVLNRPEKLNALTKPMWQRLGEAMNELSADDSVRCVVVRGAGDKAFAPGNDIAEFEHDRTNAEQARAYGKTHLPSLAAVRECRHPTVALIKGICVGGGLEIASACDLRICGTSSRFGIPIARLGLAAGYEEIRVLIGVAGRAGALELLLEGRVIGADEALQKGMVTRVVSDDKVEEEAYATARRIAEGAPLVARWHKKFIRRLDDPRPLTAKELDEAYRSYDTEDFQIGYRSFLAKTAPKFKGR
jgi:enoyl-CoA hydratase/carnithine racemase